MSPTIRDYTPGDRESYLALAHSTFGEMAPHNDPSATLDRVLSAPLSVVVVAENEGRIVGAAIGGYDGCRGWLYSVAVDAEHRRLGIGSRLIRSIEAKLCALGCTKINLQIRSGNRSVAAFYEGLGYDVEERVSMGKRL